MQNACMLMRSWREEKEEDEFSQRKLFFSCDRVINALEVTINPAVKVDYFPSTHSYLLNHVFSLFLISYPSHLSIFRNRLELECWWKYLSGATVKNSSSFWKKTRLDIWGITTTTTMEYSPCNSSSEVWNTLGISNKKMCNVLREEE